MIESFPTARLIVPAILSALIAAAPWVPLSGWRQAHASGLPQHAPVPTPGGEFRQSELSVPVPLPTPRPRRDGPAASADAAPDAAGLSAGLPKAEQACRKELAALGMRFTAQEPIAGEDGCAIAHPLLVETLSRTIALQPEALVNCDTALALARFFSEEVPGLAMRTLGQAVGSVRHASAYVCRPRRGTQRLSEHAFGNALDIGAFVLADGTVMPVEAQKDPTGKTARFLDAFRAAACGPFKTVLGPGSDADHADHFHLDMKARRNGYTFCQ